MKYYDIIRKTIEVYTNCNVHKFPVNCIEIIKTYGYKVYTYTYIQDKFPKLYAHCKGYSNDSFKHSTFEFVIYNDTCNSGRILFSLAHELGHIVFGHDEESPEYEDIANTFAGYLLAPCIMIDHYGCHSFEDVVHRFGLSTAAANIAWQNYRRWKRHAPYAEDIALLNWILYLRRPIEITESNMYQVNPFDSVLETGCLVSPAISEIAGPITPDASECGSCQEKRELPRARKAQGPPPSLANAMPLPPKDPKRSEKMRRYHKKKRMQIEKELEQVRQDMEDLERMDTDFLRVAESHWLY